MQEISPKLYRESLDSQSAAHRHNPAYVIKPTINGVKRRHVLPAGDSDDVYLFEDHGRVYCITINTRHDYCGVQAYDADDQECREELSIFCQSEEHYREILGKTGLELSYRTIARRLIAHLDECCA